MDVLSQIVQQSAIGPSSRWFRHLVIGIFLSIVIMLICMLTVLLVNGSRIPISFGY